MVACKKGKTHVSFGFLCLAWAIQGCPATSTTDSAHCTVNVSFAQSVVTYKIVTQRKREPVRCHWYSWSKKCTEYRSVTRGKKFTGYALGVKTISYPCNTTVDMPTFTAPSTPQNFSDLNNVTAGPEKQLAVDPSPGQIAGVVVGSLVAAVLCLILLLFLVRRRRRQKEQSKTREGQHQSANNQDTRTNDHYSPPYADTGGMDQNRINQSEDSSFELTNRNTAQYNHPGQEVNKINQSETSYDNLNRDNDSKLQQNMSSNLYDRTAVKPTTEGIYENEDNNNGAECSTSPNSQYDHLEKSCDTNHGKASHVIEGYDEVTLHGN